MGSNSVPWYAGTVEQAADVGADEVDMADLLGAGVLQEIRIRFRRWINAEVHALEQILHRFPHFAAWRPSPSCSAIAAAGSGFVRQDLVDQCVWRFMRGLPWWLVMGCRRSVLQLPSRYPPQSRPTHRFWKVCDGYATAIQPPPAVSSVPKPEPGSRWQVS